MGIELFKSEYQRFTFLPKNQKTKKSLKISDLNVSVGPRPQLSNFLEEDIELFNDKPKNSIAYFLDEFKSVDVNDKNDLKLLEILFKNKK